MCVNLVLEDVVVVVAVSRDGVHKVTAIWEYDKRSVNDANFVYEQGVL